jgi:hypothetical protein
MRLLGVDIESGVLVAIGAACWLWHGAGLLVVDTERRFLSSASSDDCYRQQSSSGRSTTLLSGYEVFRGLDLFLSCLQS